MKLILCSTIVLIIIPALFFAKSTATHQDSNLLEQGHSDRDPRFFLSGNFPKQCLSQTTRTFGQCMQSSSCRNAGGLAVGFCHKSNGRSQRFFHFFQNQQYVCCTMPIPGFFTSTSTGRPTSTPTSTPQPSIQGPSRPTSILRPQGSVEEIPNKRRHEPEIYGFRLQTIQY